MNKDLRKILVDQPHLFGMLLGYTDLLPIHSEWIKYLWDTKESRTLQAHRGSFKTTAILTVGVLRYKLLKPNSRVFIVRKEYKKQTVASMREIVENMDKPIFSEICQKIYGVPFKLISASDDAIKTNLKTRTTKEADIMGFSVGVSITGFHAERIITDDIVTSEDRYSEAVRDGTKRYYQELKNIIEPGYGITNSGTPWHVDDCFTIMAEAKQYPIGTVPIPRFDGNHIASLKDSMSPALYAANYELRHIADGDRLFSNPQYAELPAAWEPIAHIDKAFGGGDSIALTLIFPYQGLFYVRGFIYRKHIEDCFQIIQDLLQANNCGVIYTEDNDDKGMSANRFKGMGLHVRTYHENMNKQAKIASYLKAAWSRIRFSHETMPEYIYQICEWNENSTRDDAPDSLASVIRQAGYIKVGLGNGPARFR